MRRELLTISKALSPRRFLKGLGHNREFWRQYRMYTESAVGANTLTPELRDVYPIFGEDTSEMGYEPHYTYHCAWACRILAKTRPASHVDISSSLHFATMASAWVPLAHYDFRGPQIVLSNLTVGRADLTRLPFETDSITSLSCMHVIEHVGLGRYGDPIDALGDRRAASELSRVLAPSGQLLFVAPVGRRRVNFNAHRVYALADVLALFPKMELQSHALVPDQYRSGLIENPPAEVIDRQQWGCGCFVFGKLK